MAKLSREPSDFHLIDIFNNTYRYLDNIFFLLIFTQYGLILNESNINPNTGISIFIYFLITPETLHKHLRLKDKFVFLFCEFCCFYGDVPLAPSDGVYISI